MAQAILERLRANPAVARWPDADLTVLAGAVVLERYQQGAMLCREGRPGACCWLVLDGHLEVVRGIAGHRIEVARAGVGEWVGQLSLIDGSPRSATVMAATDTEVLVMTRDIFEQLLASQAPVALRFQRHVAMAATQNLRAAAEHLAKVLGLVAEQGELLPSDLYTVRTRRPRALPAHHGIRWPVVLRSHTPRPGLAAQPAADPEETNRS